MTTEISIRWYPADAEPAYCGYDLVVIKHNRMTVIPGEVEFTGRENNAEIRQMLKNSMEKLRGIAPFMLFNRAIAWIDTANLAVAHKITIN